MYSQLKAVWGAQLKAGLSTKNELLEGGAAQKRDKSLEKEERRVTVFGDQIEKLIVESDCDSLFPHKIFS